MNSDVIVYFVIAIAIIVAIFLILREVMCWYWKINQNLHLQEEQIKLQKQTINLLEKIVNISVKESTGNGKNEFDSKNISDQNVNPEKLTKEETETVEAKISELKENEYIVIHTNSRVIKRIHKNEYVEGKGWLIIREFGGK